MSPRDRTASPRASRIVAKARDIQAKLEKDYKLTTAVIAAASNQIRMRNPHGFLYLG